MATTFGNIIAGTIERLVQRVVIPVTGVIPVLVRTGILLVVFAAMWLAFGVALVTNRAAIDQAWLTLSGLPLPLQAVAWLLSLPVMAGLWVWGTDWPEALRLVVIVGLAAWNILVFLPRPQSVAETRVAS